MEASLASIHRGADKVVSRKLRTCTLLLRGRCRYGLLQRRAGCLLSLARDGNHFGLTHEQPPTGRQHLPSGHHLLSPRRSKEVDLVLDRAYPPPAPSPIAPATAPWK